MSSHDENSRKSEQLSLHPQDYISNQSNKTMEVILIMWPLMALIGAMVIGKQKGRTGEGLMLALLLGPLGWLCVYLGADKSPK